MVKDTTEYVCSSCSRTVVVASAKDKETPKIQCSICGSCLLYKKRQPGELQFQCR